MPATIAPAPTHELLTTKEAAEYLRIPLPTVYYLVQRGQLPAIQIGGRWRLKRSLLDRDILRTEGTEKTPHILCYCGDERQRGLWKAAFKQHRNLSFIPVETSARLLHFLAESASSSSPTPQLIILPDNPTDISLDEALTTIRNAAPEAAVAIVNTYPENLSSVLTKHGPFTIISPPQSAEAATALFKHLNLL